jgi:hypothetical protein
MRRGRTIVFATALELLCEPLFMLVLQAALLLSAVAPAMHYHQFGEASRMARDAGLSAILLCGATIAFTGPIRTFRREIETGTAQVALAHSVSRTSFFLHKAIGCAMAYGVFALTVALVSLTVVNGAEIGGRIAEKTGDIARLWGPSFTLALAAALLPIVAAAVLNRFARFRFVLTANLLSASIAILSALYRFDAALSIRLMPALALAALPSLALLAASAAFAVRFKANVASTLSAAVAIMLLPALGNYCLSDALAQGGMIPWTYLACATAAALPAIAALLLLGVHFINGRDLQ